MAPWMTSPKTEEGRITLNVTVIMGITLILFWLPIVGAFIAGFIQSRKIRDARVFLYTTGVAGAVIAILFFFLAHHMTALPVVGAIARKGSLFLSLSFTLPLIAGCLTGFSHGK